MDGVSLGRKGLELDLNCWYLLRCGENARKELRKGEKQKQEKRNKLFCG